MALVVSRQQFLSALTDPVQAEIFYQAVPADKGDTNWVQYNSAICISIEDSLSLLLKSTFGWTDAQLVAFFEQAAQLPGGGGCSALSS